MNEAITAAGVEQAGMAEARSQVYALLAMGFHYPDEETFPFLSGSAYVETLASALEICAPALFERIGASLENGLSVVSSRQEFEAAYISAFVTDMPSPSVSLYEGSYRVSGEKPALLLELKGFYRNFGLSMAAKDNDLEDALAAELEFMQFLAAKLAVAETGALDPLPYLRAQKDFLERHLAVWLPALAAETAHKLKLPFFTTLAALAGDFVAQDARQLAEMTVTAQTSSALD
jgi:DMSO reductase family type II enzyme chaperone